MTKRGQPAPNRGAGKLGALRKFFTTCPQDEELTFEDIQEKFGMSQNTVTTYVCTLKAEGVLEKVTVYRPARGVR